MDVQKLKLALARRAVEELQTCSAVSVDALVEELGLDEDAEQELWDELDEGETLIRFERFLDASPMTNSFASAIGITDFGTDLLFLSSPSDIDCDFPMTIHGAVPRGDRARAFELAGEVIVRSLRDRSLPLGGLLDDRLHIAADFPGPVLVAAYTQAFDEGLVDMADLEEVLRSLGAWPPEADELSGPDRSRRLATAYVSATRRLAED